MEGPVVTPEGGGVEAFALGAAGRVVEPSPTLFPSCGFEELGLGQRVEELVVSATSGGGSGDGGRGAGEEGVVAVVVRGRGGSRYVQWFGAVLRRRRRKWKGCPLCGLSVYAHTSRAASTHLDGSVLAPEIEHPELAIPTQAQHVPGIIVRRRDDVDGRTEATAVPDPDRVVA